MTKMCILKQGKEDFSSDFSLSEARVEGSHSFKTFLTFVCKSLTFCYATVQDLTQESNSQWIKGFPVVESVIFISCRSASAPKGYCE